MQKFLIDVLKWMLARHQCENFWLWDGPESPSENLMKRTQIIFSVVIDCGEFQ